MKMLSVYFLSILRFRLNRKKAKSKKRRVIEKVVVYKCIPRHMHIISFEHMLFVNQRVKLLKCVLYIVL